MKWCMYTLRLFIDNNNYYNVHLGRHQFKEVSQLLPLEMPQQQFQIISMVMYFTKIEMQIIIGEYDMTDVTHLYSKWTPT